ncbi:MAG: hypothetical protein R3B09_32590 [Nannocystaceae bacterium]
MTRPPAAWLRRAATSGILGLAACGSRPEATSESTTSAASESTASDTDDTDATAGETEGQPLPSPAPLCATAPTIGQGHYVGTLRDVGVEPIGVCGQAGPVTYLRVATDLHVDLKVTATGVGFTPRVDVAPAECIAGLTVACGLDGALAVPDLLAGSVWLVRIGAAFDDPALALPIPLDGSPDPLTFTVDVDLQRVLDPGDVCVDDPDATGGRCPAGTLCLATADPDDDPALRICTLLDGDTCESAAPLALDALAGSLPIDLDAPQSDAHTQSCAGAGTRERVLRAELSADFPPASTLTLRVDTPGVDLAVRSPTCDLVDELACEVGGIDGVEVVLDDPAMLAAAGLRPWIFVEIADDASGSALLEWSVE